MDHWHNARDQLFKSLGEVCDRFGHELANVIPRETDVVLHRDEVEVLRERSERVYKLVEENERLVNELKERREAAARERTLQDETNARILDQEQVNEQTVKNFGAFAELAASDELSRTPHPPEPPSSVIQKKDGDSDDVRYHTLSEKYNKLAQNYKELRTGHQMLTEALKTARSKNVEWNRYSDCRDKLLAKKNGIIAGLEDEVRTLKSRVGDRGRDPRFSQSGSTTREMLVDALEKETLKNWDFGKRIECRTKEVASKEPKVARLKDQIRGFQSRIRDCENNLQLGHDNVTTHPANATKSRGQAIHIQELVAYIHAGPFHDGSKVLDRDNFVNYISNYDITDCANGNEANEMREHGIAEAEQTISSGKTGIKSELPSQGDASGTSGPQLPLLLDTTINTHYPSEDVATEAVEHYSSTTQDTSSPPATPGHILGSPVEEGVFQEPSPSPDVPVVIFSRSVTKKRRRDTPVEATPAPKIKIESISSSPIGLCALRVEESVDLDDIGGKVDTPRKRRRMRSGSSQTARSQASPKGESQNSNTASSGLGRHKSTFGLDTPSAAPKVGSALTPLNSNKQILRRNPRALPAKQKRAVSDKSIADISEDGENTPPLQSLRNYHAKIPGKVQRLDSLLAQPSPPKHVLLTSPAVGPTLIQGHASSASSGSSLANELVSTVSYRDTGLGPETPKLSTALLEGLRQAGSSSLLLRTPSVQAAQAPGYSSRPSSALVSRGGSVQTGLPVAEGNTLQSSMSTPMQARGQLGANPALSRIAPSGATPSSRKRQQLQAKEQAFRSDVAPEHEPLRTRPLETLSIEDFKVNPDYNHGHKFAFSDVVRTQASRRCLPGCTKPECCGTKFRALAEVQRNPDDPLTLSQEEADARLLEEFLGDNAHKLGTMSKAERIETLLQARTRELARKHGKHRHAFERRKSPPGFWRTDFPTTQEEGTDKEKAKEFERQLVAQRYEEAMRPKGAFTFRDE